MLATIYIEFFKIEIIDLFIVDNANDKKPDLIVVLEGGSIKFAPSHERAIAAINAYGSNKSKVLVCSIRELKGEIEGYLISKGINKSDLVQAHYEYDSSGGTYNNIKEILSVLKVNKNYKNILVVTSPYHELRVNTMIVELINSDTMYNGITINYSNIKNSEITKTNNSRFMKIISHELLGILVFKFTHLYSKYISTIVVEPSHEIDIT